MRRHRNIPIERPSRRWLAAHAVLAAPGLFVLLLSHLASAQSVLPQGGKVSSGQATIGDPSGGALVVRQTSTRAVVDWNGFSIGAGNSVTFAQPSSAAAILNRVTGSTPSSIAGQLTANGQVFLVNPNGIFITPDGKVQAGAFVASTLGIGNTDFNTGNYNFTGNGASAGVSNAGTITAPGGYVGLLGGTVSNAGTINAYLGRVGLGAGEQIIINPGGDGFLQVAVPTNAAAPGGRALVDVSGRISAAGGEIQVNAASAQNAARDVINVSGRLSAASVSGSRGNITLSGSPAGTVAVTGSIAANGGKNRKDGSIAVTGGTVNLRGAQISASGGSGGGTVEIGGGPQGSGSLAHATTTNVDSGTTIRADATVKGDGGNVTVWADGTTTFGGFISAKGGPRGGDGGRAEVSGKNHLNLTGDYTKLPLANLSAPLGKAGNLLFDPGTVVILDQASLANNTALNGPDTFTAQFISTQLGSANVTISTTNATGANGGAGDINLLSNAQIAWWSNNTLTLSAARNINFAAGASISGNGASSSVVLRADAAGAGVGTVAFTGGTQLSAPTVDLYYNPASNRTVANGGSNNSAGTVNGTSYTGTPAAENWSSFISATTTRAWMLVNNVFDLQNIQNRLSGLFALGTNVDAAATSGWNSGAGFVPLGTNGSGSVLNGGLGFNGQFDGQGNTISNLTINRGSSDRVGLFGYTSGATIENLGLAGANVTGGSGGTAGSGSGTLVGVADNSTLINNVSVAGVMTGAAGAGANWNIGGIVGELYHGSSLTSSRADVTVNSALNSTGGAVGALESGGSILDTYSTGSVTASGRDSVAGLAGYSDGTVARSYATGAVTGDTNVGGLVGDNNYGSITNSYATGAVTGSTNVGGLAGINRATGTIDKTYATGDATGVTLFPSNLGGLVGNNAGSISNSYSTGAAAYSVFWGLFGSNIGGFVGNNSGTISSSYFDSDTSRRGSGVGFGLFGSGSATALTTGQAMTQASYAGWDFNNIWWMRDGNTRPFLRAEYSTTIANAHQLQLINMSNAALGASYTLRGTIDMSETSAGTGMWGSAGFVPLGTDGGSTILNGGNGFRGSFDGSGGSIGSLFINRPTATNVGLFGYVGSGGTIANTTLTGVNITGQGAGVCCDNGVGALAGWNAGTITGSSSSGSVTGDWNVGGLVGENTGSISKSWSSVNVSNPSGPYATGGLVGWNTDGGTISQSYARGSVSSPAGQYVGGLVGTNEDGATITQSYATGSVSGSSNLGGLIGWNTPDAGAVTSSYFDNQTTGQIAGVGTGTAAGTGLTTATFKNGSLPAGFDWWVWSATVGQYPVLNGAPQTIKVTATAGAGGITYGDSAPSVGYTVTDTNGVVLCSPNCSAYFSGAPVVDTTARPTAPAGTPAGVYAAQGTISAAAGYVIQFVNDVVSVAAKALTITASNQSKSYGTNLNLGNSAFTVGGGLINGDTVSSVTLTSAGSAAGAGVAGSPYALIPSNAVGTGLSNYAITYVNGTLTVTAVPITVAALGGSSTYGASPANPGLSAVGLVNGETAAVLTGLSNSFGINNLTNAGSYPTSVAGVLTNLNYTVTGASGSVWTVNPAPVNVTALGGSSSYGASPANPGLSATGLQNGQTVAALTGLSNSFNITNLTNAGSYATSVLGTLTNGNYTVAATNPGVWTVNPAAVVVTALGGSSTYGASPANPGLSATGLQNGQTVAALTGLTNSFGIANLTDAGGYVTSVLGALTNTNYTVSARNAGLWTVNPAPITVLALGGNSNYGILPLNPGLAAIGLQNGQGTGVLTGLVNSFGITIATLPGTYATNVQGLLLNSNYTVTKTVAGSWTVFPAGQPLPVGNVSSIVTGSIGAVTGAADLPSLQGAVAEGAAAAGGGGSVGVNVLRLSSPMVGRAAAGESGASVLPAQMKAPAGDDNAAMPKVELPAQLDGLNAMAFASPKPAAKPAEKKEEEDDCTTGTSKSGDGKGGRGAGGGRKGCKAAGEGLLNFSLNEQTKSSVVDSIETALTEMVSAKSSKYSVARNVTAGTTIAVTAGIIGWLLRGGALLSAMLSSVPLWREFDPLVVVQRPRRPGIVEITEVDKLFDAAGGAAAPAKG